jgi:hypothetical protein
MPEREPDIDREASEAVKRIERQMFVEGKLDKAVAAEGAGILFLPLLLGAAGLISWVLTSLGLEGPELIFVGVPALIGLGVLALYLGRKK